MARIVPGYEYDICLLNATAEKSLSATARKTTSMMAG